METVLNLVARNYIQCTVVATHLTICRLPKMVNAISKEHPAKKEKQCDKACHLNNFRVSLMFRLRGLVEKRDFGIESLRGKLE